MLMASVLVIALGVTTGCSSEPAEAHKASSETVQQPEPSAVAPPAQKLLSGEVVMDPTAPELKRMTIEPVRGAMVELDEVITPARIQANPHNVGHAVVPVPGRIVRVMTKLGDSVSKGQALVTIESSSVAEAEAAFVQGEAALRQAEISTTKADADLARVTDLYEHQAVAQKEVLAAQTTASLTKSAVEQAKSIRDQARRRLELLGLKSGAFDQKVVVTAPISGKVMEVSVVEGEFRNEINTPLVTITDLSRVWVESEVPESKIRLFHAGGYAQLELIAFPGETFRARITRLADAVDSETRTIKVDAEMVNEGGKLRPEMFGSLRYSAGQVQTPWIPEAAVVRQNGVDFVFIEKAPGRFAPVPVELGKLQNGGFSVSKGLKIGDRAVTQGAVYLKAAL